jgi:hypothetical protein
MMNDGIGLGMHEAVPSQDVACAVRCSEESEDFKEVKKELLRTVITDITCRT